MNTLPDNLTDDELTLLRLAGELPVGVGRAHGTATDDSRDTSRELREAFALLDGPLTLAAAHAPLPSAGPSVRAVVRAMNDAASATPAEGRRRRALRLPGWVLYPAAAAALLMFGMFGWWYQVHDQYAKATDPPRLDPGPPVLLLRGEPDGDLANKTDDQIERQFDSMIIMDRSDRLTGGEVERQFAALKFLEESVQ